MIYRKKLIRKWTTRSIQKLKVSVIVPTLNEEESIGKVLTGLWKNDLVKEVIVVDSSSDDTAKIAEKLRAKVIHETRKGYGRALQTGIKNAKGDVVVYIDGDYSYDPKDVSRIVKPILNGEFDVVLGNRFGGRMYDGAMSFTNKIGNLLISFLFAALFTRRIIDTQCGLRAIRKCFLNKLFCSDYGMAYVTEQLIKLIRRGARITMMPVTYRPRMGKTKLRTFTDGFRIVKVILRERFLGEDV